MQEPISDQENVVASLRDAKADQECHVAELRDDKADQQIPFAERWSQLLDSCKASLKNLKQEEDKDAQIRNLWTSINKFVTIMAVPKEIMPKARMTLLKMACRSSFSQAIPLCIYTLMTFLPRHWYRNSDTQHWFKQRLSNRNTL